MFNASRVAPLDLRLYVDGLRRRPDLKDALIGSQSLFSDVAAKIANMTHPQALSSFYGLTEQVVLVSSGLAVLQTAGSHEQWQDKMTEEILSDPENAVNEVRFRPSRHGGRSWVRPALLTSTIRQAMCETVRTRTEATLHSIIRIGGALGAQPEALSAFAHANNF